MKTRNIISIFILLISSFYTIEAQEYEFRFYIGANYYQGDLAPRKDRFSFSPGRLGLAAMFGAKLSNVFRLNAKFMIGQIGADDANAKLESRKRRNLSFDSPIYEAGLNTEINFNHFIKALDKFGINVYYTTGLNVFKFSPKATLFQQTTGKYQLIDLQPLGTEGQGLDGYEEKYALTQLNIPFGIGFKFQLFENIELGFEFAPRLTFTDYLDDVSGTYVRYEDLIAANRPLTAILANRTGEYLGTGPVMVESGTFRGDPTGNDWYFFASTYFSYNFGKGYVVKKLIKVNDLDSSEPIEKENKK